MGQSIGSLFPLRFRLWLGRKLYKPLDSNVVRVSWHRVIKGPCGPPEVEAMQYIAKHTAIPIPKVYRIHTTQENYIYIEMEYIQGDALDTAWRALTADQKQAIFKDIKEYTSILRDLKPPTEDLVASALQNPVYDGRIGSRYLGPFSHANFHSLLRQNLPIEHVAHFLGKDVEKVHSTSYRTCFTHADLVPRNIMVRNGRVAAIIDWGYSGWYPEYWEFVKARYGFFQEKDWLEYIHQIYPCYDLELTAEQTLWEMFPDTGTPATLSRGDEVIKLPGSKPSATWLDARAGRQLNDLWSVALSSDHYTSE